MKQSKIIGILLMILGIAVCVAGIGIHIVYLYDRYQGFAEHGYFDSFLHYYYAVGKGNLLTSVLIGAIPAASGIYLMRRK